jgi:hypothetical protein
MLAAAPHPNLWSNAVKFIEVSVIFDVLLPERQAIKRLINVEHVAEISLEPHAKVAGRYINFFDMASGHRHWVSAEDHSLIIRAVGAANYRNPSAQS